jgi:hypothetical protein
MAKTAHSIAYQTQQHLAKTPSIYNRLQDRSAGLFTEIEEEPLIERIIVPSH